MTDHYRTLDVARTAPAAEIQRAYRALALRYHPDRNPSPEAAVRMTSINEAWEVLGDPDKRREYDLLLAKPPLSAELARSILQAAREAVLRQSWLVIADDGQSLLLEKARSRIRVMFLSRAGRADVLRAASGEDFCVVLAAQVELPDCAGSSAAVIDLLRSERYGAPLPEGAVRSLFACFL